MSWSSKSGYLLVLILLVSAPLFLAPLLSREQIYNSLSFKSRNARDFEFVHKVIFEEKVDIDILISGASRAWSGLLPEIIERELTAKFKRPVVSRNLSYNWSREDLLYVMLRDLLRHRKVKVLILGLTTQGREVDLHPGLYELWSNDGFADDVITNFEKREAISYAATRSYDWPRKLVTLLRPDLRIADNSELGGNPIYGNLQGKEWLADSPASDFSPTVPRFPPEQTMYSKKTASRFRVQDHFDSRFLDKVVSLAAQHHVQIMFVYLPPLAIEETVEIAKTFLTYGKQSKYIVGIPTRKLFSGLSSDETKKLFYHKTHLNLNGARYFTRAILPSIEKVYEDAILAR